MYYIYIYIILFIYFIYLFYLFILSDMTYAYKIIQYKNKPYSDNNEHRGSVALTDA